MEPWLIAFLNALRLPEAKAGAGGALRGPGGTGWWGLLSLSQCLNRERKLRDGHFCAQAQRFLVKRPVLSHMPCHTPWGAGC